MRLTTLEHLQRDAQMHEEAIDWLQIVLGVAIIVGLIVATPYLREIASYGWGL